LTRAFQEQLSHSQNTLQPGDLRNMLSTVTNMTYDFRVSVGGCQWLIRVEPTGLTREYANYEYAEAGYDGTKICYVVAASSGENSDANSKLTGREANKAVARILSGDVPYEMPVIPALWLAYCSSCYFDNVEKSGARRIIAIHRAIPQGRSSDALLREASWMRSELPPRLLATLTYLDDGFHVEVSDGEVKKTPLIAPFNQGYVTAKFEAGFTNIGDMTLSSDFTFMEFRPNWSEAKSTNDLILKKRTSGHVVRYLSKSSIESYLPGIPVNTPVADTRFRSQGAPLVAYVTNAWLSTGEVALSSVAIFKASADAATKREAKHGTSRRFFVRTVLVAAMLAPIIVIGVLYILRRKKSQLNHHKKEHV